MGIKVDWGPRLLGAAASFDLREFETRISATAMALHPDAMAHGAMALHSAAMELWPFIVQPWSYGPS